MKSNPRENTLVHGAVTVFWFDLGFFVVVVLVFSFGATPSGLQSYSWFCA